MEEKRLQELILTGDVLEDIPQKYKIESPSEGHIPLKNVIATNPAESTQVLLQTILIQIKSGHGPAVSLFNLSLHDAVTATHLCHFPRVLDQWTRQAPKYLKSAPDPEMIERGQLKVSIRHADRGGT
jgi:hypothetical protein